MKFLENVLKIYGPYLRKDGRKHIVIKYLDGRKVCRSYPKYLMELHIGRELTDDETVDHKDDDFTNDDLSNLQILTRRENVLKQHARKPAIILSLLCVHCGAEIIRSARVERRRIKRGSRGPFCSTSCSSKDYQAGMVEWHTQRS